MAKTLELIFKNGEGKTARFSVPEPVEPVDPSAVNAAMDLMIAKNIFVGGLTEKVGARVIDNTVTEIALS
jgi:hypothetical protein